MYIFIVFVNIWINLFYHNVLACLRCQDGYASQMEKYVHFDPDHITKYVLVLAWSNNNSDMYQLRLIIFLI